VFESGWVQLDESWKKPELVEKWTRLRNIRTEVNKVLEQARAEKMIGSSLEAKVLLHVPDTQLRQQLRKLNPSGIPRLWLQTPKPELMVMAEEPKASPPPEMLSSETGEQEWNINQILFTVLTTLRQVFSENQRVWLTVGVVVAVPITLKVTATVLASIARLPLVADILQLVGVGYSAWFINRYLLRAPNRQELAEKARSLKTEVLGEASVQPEPETVEPEAEPPAPVQPQPQPKILGERFTVLSNGVDELRYLFLASQVEVLDTPDALENADYRSQSDQVWVGVVKAEGEKCDRCWNYSPFVGKIIEHPTICERCRAALAGQW
jgi:isoleucyl-tRNA synthetase